MSEHPIQSLLNNVSNGYEPTGKELDDLAALGDDPEVLKKELTDVIDRITDHRAAGQNGKARAEARETWMRLAPTVAEPEPKPDPYADEMDPAKLAALALGEVQPEDLDPDDPRSLAADVPRPII